MRESVIKLYSFKNDYSEGAHPRIMEALLRTNLEQTSGYGLDPHCEHARALIREKIGAPEADVHFLTGGTQANLTVITAVLRAHQAVIAAQTGHINVHETGAIEATGHKVIAVETPDGRLTPEQIATVCDAHTDEHMVQPKMVYISNSTEIGTCYTKAEIEALSKICRTRGLWLYLDGARLASALAAESNDVSFSDLAELCDLFYIGGTKCGALFGEAVVILNERLKPDFRYFIKQRGGMLAKGRLLGIQFEELFADELYLELGRHSNRMAMRMRDCFLAAGVTMASESESNQQFPILGDEVIAELEKEYAFEIQSRVDAGNQTVRFVTSWATKEDEADRFVAEFAKLSKAHSPR